MARYLNACGEYVLNVKSLYLWPGVNSLPALCVGTGVCVGREKMNG